MPHARRAHLRITTEVEDDKLFIRTSLGGATFEGEKLRTTVIGRSSFTSEQLRTMNRGDYARAVRAEAIRLLTHELDEHLRVDGARVFDPHRNERRL